MLRPIPASVLGDIAVIRVCTGVDVWQNPEWEEYMVKPVHLQNTNEVRKSKENTEIVLRSILFIDSVHSRPSLDYGGLAEKSQAAGKPMHCTVYSAAGEPYGEYEVAAVDIAPDVPARRVHHTELGLV